MGWAGPGAGRWDGSGLVARGGSGLDLGWEVVWVRVGG